MNKNHDKDKNKESFSSYFQSLDKFLCMCLSEAFIPCPRIKEAMSYTLFPGGKRFRPLLIFVCGELCLANSQPLDTQAANFQCLVILAAAVECMHAYSLVHDDLPAMDNDDFRRGKPSCHKAFDEATAILAGDGLQTLGFQILLNYLPKVLAVDKVLLITSELAKAIGPQGMVSGQSLDLTLLIKTQVSQAELLRVHRLKTGLLISACINMLCLAFSVPEQEQIILQDFADYLGIVYQMHDDFLDAYSSQLSLTKQRNSDAANQKFTFANFYSTHDEFLRQITWYYQQTREALLPFGHRAHKVIALINQLEQRS